MLINEVCKRCGLTKKAIEYYEEQGLTRPQIMENGYRVFSEDDVIQLNKIAVLRGLGISVSDIKTVLAENDRLSFQTICDKKELEISDIQAKQQLLHMLARNQNWEDARAQLSQLETKRSILSRLLDRFPGYFGKFISLHFAPYLNERVATDEQQDAFETIIDFLDGVNIVIPDDLKEYLDDTAKTIDLVDVSKKAAASVDLLSQLVQFGLVDSLGGQRPSTATPIRASFCRRTGACRSLSQPLFRVSRNQGVTH